VVRVDQGAAGGDQLSTERQQRFIHFLVAEVKWDRLKWEQFLRDQYGTSQERLTQRQATEVIDILQELRG